MRVERNERAHSVRKSVSNVIVQVPPTDKSSVTITEKTDESSNDVVALYVLDDMNTKIK